MLLTQPMWLLSVRCWAVFRRQWWVDLGKEQNLPHAVCLPEPTSGPEGRLWGDERTWNRAVLNVGVVPKTDIDKP